MHSGLPYVHPGALRVHEHTEAFRRCVVCTLIHKSTIFVHSGEH